MDNVITVNNLSFSYDTALVLDKLSLKIKKGELSCLIGPNGGGKTTFLKLLMGFLKPQSGTINLFNTSVRKANKFISYVPQVLHFDRHFPISAYEVVLSGRLINTPWWHSSYSKSDKDAALSFMNKLGIEDLKNQSFGSLSGGQAQRTLIARALVSEPKLLLLDEPTACVDVHAESDIYRFLTELKRKITILMVTHDLDAIEKEVDKVYCIHGKLETFTPNDVCQHHSLGLYHQPKGNNL